MSELGFFTVTCAGISSIGVDYIDAGTDPDPAWIYAFCDFIPRLPKGTVIWAPGLTTPRGIQLDTIRARFDTDGVLRTIVGAIQNEVQSVAVSGSPTSITLTLSGQTTASIAMSSNTAAASLVQTRLEALSNIGSGNVFVSGTNPWAVTFRGALAGTNMAQMTGTPTGGTSPTVVVTTLETGSQDAGVKLVANTPVLELDELIYDISFSVPFRTRTIRPFAVAAPLTAGVTIDLSDRSLHLPAR